MQETKSFGLYLSELREKSGFKSQRQLAAKSGISSATLSRIESGLQKPQAETLKTLATSLRGVSYEDLLMAAGILEDDHLPDSHSSSQSEDFANETLMHYLQKFERGEMLDIDGSPLPPEDNEFFITSIKKHIRERKNRMDDK